LNSAAGGLCISAILTASAAAAFSAAYNMADSKKSGDYHGEKQ
jgi:hypothetical protein